MNNKDVFFNFEDETYGNISIGKIPSHLHNNTKYIQNNFYKNMNENCKKKTSYHEWYNDINPNIQKKIDQIIEDKFWKKNICNLNKCKLIRIKEMDEIYYANPPKKLTKNLYGAIGNYGVHTDGFLKFKDINVYRVLIGLTDGNDNMTYFTDHGYGKLINKNEYVLFDFDKSKHQVLINNDGNKSKYRLILKLHFLVCKGNYSDFYINFLIKYYSNYLKLTRYVQENGTNPKTLKGFFFGVISSIIGTDYNILLSIFVFFILLFIFYIIEKNKKLSNIIYKTLLSELSIFILIIIYNYFSFLMLKNNME